MIQAAGWWDAASSLFTELDQTMLKYIPPTLTQWQATNLSGEEDVEELAADVGDERRRGIAAQRCVQADQSFPNAAQLASIRHHSSTTFNGVDNLAYSLSFGLLAELPVEACTRATMLLNFEVWYVWATAWSQMS